MLEVYRKATKELGKELGVKNPMALPRVQKVTINVGLGQAKQDPKLTDVVVSTLTRITGQKPVLTKAKKSISSFKIREGMTVGAKVTLRGKRMWEFLDKLVSLALPRVRDFSGLSSNSFDRQGNYTIGFREHLVFPEIKSDEVEKIHGLELTISTTAKNEEQTKILLLALGFPFVKK
ncbi:MAG: 50S ribosomal protein L5 [bacterium]